MRIRIRSLKHRQQEKQAARERLAVWWRTNSIHNGLRDALTTVTRSISTSFKEPISPAELTQMLRTGEAPEKYHPHLMVLLEETPLPLVTQAVHEVAGAMTPKQIQKHLAQWVAAWKTRRRGS